MEAGDSGQRQSGPPHPPPATNSRPDYYSQRPREPLDRPPLRPTSSTMATAALMSPSTPHYSHHSPFSPYPSHPTSAPAPTSAMISPVDSTRRSDESEPVHRQSLPSIRDIIGKGNPGGANAPSLPSPFPSHSAAPPRPYGEHPHEKPPSPRQPDRAQGYSRPEPLPPFQDSLRHPPPRPSLSIFPGAHSSAPKPSIPEITERRHPQPPPPQDIQPSGSYAHHHAPPPPRPGAGAPPPPPPPSSHPHMPPPLSAQVPPPYSGAGPVPLPPGQLPLSNYPISPRHGVPPMASPYNAQRPPMSSEEADRARNQLKYPPQPPRHFESWGYADCLAKIGASAHHIFEFAENFAKIAQEEQHGPPMTGRMPSDPELSDMIANCEHMIHALEAIRSARIAQMTNDRHRDGGHRGSRGGYGDDEDVNMYNDGMKQNYNVMETKKRRGRAAPPGRCHSCNRMDTPEWRRGPDGARTLCNACGLHYAKLERKKQMERGQARKDGSK